MTSCPWLGGVIPYQDVSVRVDGAGAAGGAGLISLVFVLSKH